MACHEEVATKFAQNPHSRIALMHGGQGSTCESCPGPGKEHVEAGGDVTKIFRFSHPQPSRSTALAVRERATS